MVPVGQTSYGQPEPEPSSPPSNARFWPPEACKATAALGICQKCGVQGTILWGKFSHYWKCPKCQGNTAIKEFCPTCHERLKLRKDKNRFFKHCDACRTESLYFEATN
ncbi:MAG: hypothetical protein IT578_05030 [Verrucomicrobiae bacterium]|nr:hypothetical protein [Verrucomicrobiae bacterium]